MFLTRKRAQFRNDAVPHRSMSVDTAYNKTRLCPAERMVTFPAEFQIPKVKYSKETADLMKMLMEESKMTMMLRKQIDSHLRRGEPLPKPKPRRMNTFAASYTNSNNLMHFKHNGGWNSVNDVSLNYPRLAPIDQKLANGGAFDQLHNQQSKTTNCKHFSESNLKPQRKQMKELKQNTPVDIINELLDQINERAIWLEKIEELGEGKKYRDEIRGQIAQKLHQIKALEAKIALQKNGFHYVD